MDVVQAIQARKSIRSYKPDPVPKAILQEILQVATRAPSGTNCQPWEVTVITGEVLDRIGQENVGMVKAGEPGNPDIVKPPLTGVYQQRSIPLAKQLFGLLGIARDDKEKRDEWRLKGYRFFDAPAAIILYVDETLGDIRGQFELGLLTENICLAALNYGLGTCIEGQGVTYPEVVKRIAGIPASKKLVTSIAIGYPDWEYPANKVVSEREPLENVVTWRGFD